MALRLTNYELDTLVDVKNRLLYELGSIVAYEDNFDKKYKVEQMVKCLDQIIETGTHDSPDADGIQIEE